MSLADVIETAIRRAREDDADFLAWAILIASRGHLAKGWFDIALNRIPSECLNFIRQLTLTHAISRWHYSAFWVVEIAQRPVAALCGFDFARMQLLSPLAFDEAAKSAKFSSTERAAIWERGAYIFCCPMHSGGNAWVIESIATLPEFRGKGYTDALLTQACEDAKRRRFERAEITVMIGNEHAEWAYRRHGFHSDSEVCNPLFESVTGSPGLRRLVKEL